MKDALEIAKKGLTEILSAKEKDKIALQAIALKTLSEIAIVEGIISEAHTNYNAVISNVKRTHGS